MTRSHPDTTIGHRFVRHGVVTSTNDLAWELTGEPDAHGTVIVAEEQTAGRGRRGDPWWSPPGGGLLLSLIVTPPPFLCRPVILTLWAALGICRTIQELFQVHATLKWPNDVQIEGKKVAGVLVEQRQQRFVIGVGINLTVPLAFFAEHYLPRAAAVSLFTPQRIDREAFLTALLHHWETRYQEALRSDFAALEADWHAHTGWLGRRILLEAAGIEHEGVLHRMNVDALTLQSGSTTMKFIPESIQRLAPI